MAKFPSGAPCPYHGLLKPGAKYTNVIYNNKSVGHVPRQQQQQQHRVNEAGEAPKTVEPIWDIVSGLAQALNDAKDQLASLMQSRSNSPLKTATGRGTNQIASNGNNCVNSHGGLNLPRAGSPRCYSAPHRSPGRRRGPQNGIEEEDGPDPYNRNIHRSHAHGYCAFGRNTEFKEKMHHSGRQLQSSPARGGRGGAGRGAGGRAVGEEFMPGTYPGNYGIRLQGGTGACGIKVIPNSKSYTCRTDRGKQGLHLQAKMKNCDMNVDTDGERFGPNYPMKLHFSTPTKVRYPSPNNRHPPQASAEVKRYCVGTQYANLLREEAHHLREKRIREESKIMKNHC